MIKKVNIAEIKANAENPRFISDASFKKLVKSIKEFPEMLELRPLVVDENMVVLGGNMRLKALKSSGVFEVTVKQVHGLTEEQKKEFIVKDNVGFGEWDWDVLANNYSFDDLIEWGLDIPLEDRIDELEEEEEIELPQSVQLEPPKEYILVMAEPNSVEWEDLKETLKLGMVRRGGYKKGSPFDAVALERVLYWDDLKKRLNADSSTE